MEFFPFSLPFRFLFSSSSTPDYFCNRFFILIVSVVSIGR